MGGIYGEGDGLLYLTKAKRNPKTSNTPMN